MSGLSGVKGNKIMKTENSLERLQFPRSALWLAMLAAFSPLHAEENDEVARLIQPESSISLGVGQVSGDNQRFGIYNGLNKEGTVGLGDFSVVRRDDETGRWLRLQGRNLGLSTRELSAEYEKQGDYRVSIDYSQLPRVAPYEIHTDLRGIGSNNQSYPAYNPPAPPTERPATAASAISLKTERQITKLGFSKSFSPTLELKVNFQNDEKEGNRIFGRGYVNAQEFLAEPIDSTIRQLDAVLNYTGERLQLSGGYYGSFYENRYKSLNVAGGSGILNGTAAGAQVPPIMNLGLPPDNQAHQLHLSGAYEFTRTTRASFKASRSVALQNDDFMPVATYTGVGSPVGTNSSRRTDLGGRIETTLVQLGVISRPLKGLALTGNLRYEDRDDRTQVAQYLTGTTGPTYALPATSSTNGFNEPRSLTIRSGKGEASYQLPEGFRVIGGVEVEQKERSTAGVRVVGYREKTEETTYRLELKRTMADALTGSVAYLHSDRDGSDYRRLTTLNGTTAYPNYGAGLTFVSRGGLLQPIYLADRERDKVRLGMDWSPIEALSAQFTIEDAKDDYGPGRGTPDIGPRKGEARLYSVDLTYNLSEQWKLTGWAAHSETKMDQAALANPTSNLTATVWSAALKNQVDSYAVGLRGKLLSARLDVGADFVYAHDKSSYSLATERAGSAAVSSLPDITWKQATLKVFGRYAVNKDWATRLDYVFDQRKTNDWTWTGWTYSDGTRIVQRPEDKVHFIGVSANYSFR